MEEMKLYAGYACDKITPPMGVHIPGHGFVPRLSTGIIDDVYVSAVAFSWGETRGILFNCDALGITTKGALEIQRKVSERTGIPADAVYIACTHCHTSVYLGRPSSDGDAMDVYHGRSHQIFCDLAQFALEDLKPAKLLAAQGELKGVGFIRRYKMKDGTLKTNPRTGDPDILCPDGVQDESLQLIRIQREGGKEIVLINFGTHPDVVGGTRYSPDWPGYTVKCMKEALDGESEVVMLNGFGGDSNHLNRSLPLGTPKEVQNGLPHAKRMARKVTGEALKIYDDAKEIPAGTVAGYQTPASLGKNPHEPWEVPIAEKIVATGARVESELPEELKKEKMSIKKARRILQNENGPKDYVVAAWGLQVGSLAFIGFPGEPFSETGIEIKKKSPMAVTMLSCRTNGSEGYFPTRRAFDGAGYERDYTNFGPGCADALIDAAEVILQKMNQNL